jgi:YfiH family protein
MTLDIITGAALAPLRHGFFGRAGGASSGVFQGLNCGHGSSDQTEAVTINRARVAEAMGVAPEALIGVHQVHSAEVLTVTAPPAAAMRADALVTATPGLALTVLTADCQPVLLADPEAQVIGAAHAGWKGAIGGILEATVEAMAALGAAPARIRAVIGPAISQQAYEVGPDFFDAVMAADDTAARFFAAGTGDRLHFDLPGYGLSRLRAAGVAEAGWTRHCTYAEPDRFFSYRRSVHQKEADYGRLIATIRL